VPAFLRTGSCPAADVLVRDRMLGVSLTGAGPVTVALHGLALLGPEAAASAARGLRREDLEIVDKQHFCLPMRRHSRFRPAWPAVRRTALDLSRGAPVAVPRGPTDRILERLQPRAPALRRGSTSGVLR